MVRRGTEEDERQQRNQKCRYVKDDARSRRAGSLCRQGSRPFSSARVPIGRGLARKFTPRFIFRSGSRPRERLSIPLPARPGKARRARVLEARLRERIRAPPPARTNANE